MSFWSRFNPFPAEKRAAETRYSMPAALSDAEGIFKLLGLEFGKVNVSANTALGLSAYMGSVRVMANLFASQPAALLQKKDGTRQDAGNEPLKEVLGIRPSRHQTPTTFKRTLLANVLVYGNGIARIYRDANRNCIELRAYGWKEVRVFETNDSYFYEFPDGQVLPEEDVIHLKYMSLDGKMGTAPWGFTPKTIRIALSTQEFVNKYYENGTFLGGILTSSNDLNKEKADAAKKMWNDSTAKGVGAAGDIVVLGNGLSFQSVGKSPVESQMVEFFSKTDLDIYRIMGVPGYMLGDASQNNTWGGTGLESLFTAFLNTTMMPFIKEFEEELTYKAIREDKRQAGQYVKVNLNNLLRPDAKTRYDIYRIAIDKGLMSQNDVAELEDRNGTPDGNRRWMQQGYMPLDKVDEILNKQNGGNTSNGKQGTQNL